MFYPEDYKTRNLFLVVFLSLHKLSDLIISILSILELY